MPYSSSDGVMTFVGQALTQRWQALHDCVKCSRLTEPGGVIGGPAEAWAVRKRLRIPE